MSADFQLPGMGFGAFLLSMNTMLMLEKKGVFTSIETKEIVEQALLNLETHEMEADPADRATFQASRTVLEGLRQLLSHP